MSEHFCDRKSLIASQVAFPVRCDDSGMFLFDANGDLLMEVRGYGRLMCAGVGEEQAGAIQKEIGDAFADAFNKEYGP